MRPYSNLDETNSTNSARNATSSIGCWALISSFSFPWISCRSWLTRFSAADRASWSATHSSFAQFLSPLSIRICRADSGRDSDRRNDPFELPKRS